MGAPLKNGLDYFSIDVQLNDNIKMIIYKHGVKGLGLLVMLYQKIYAEGYFKNWGENNKIILAHEANITTDEINSIINDCLNEGIFNRNLFENEKILTSHGIQKRYAEATRRRQKVEIIKKYNLLREDEKNDNMVNVDNKPVNDDNNPLNAGILQHNVEAWAHNAHMLQRSVIKVKESKVNKIKVKKSKGKNTQMSTSSCSASKKTNGYLDFKEKLINSWEYLSENSNISGIRKITGGRNRKLKARYKETVFRENIEEILNKLKDDAFCNGDNDRGWTATFDWLVYNDTNYIKILEGQYKPKKKKMQSTSDFLNIFEDK